MTTTPPIHDRARTPSAPLHGPKFDSPRRSSRIHTKQMHSPRPFLATSPPRSRKHLVTQTSSQTLSPPSSPTGSPRRSTPLRNTLSRHSHTSRMDPDISDPKPHGGRVGMDMLPTPVKTPRKRPTLPKAQVSSTARVLFNDQPDELEDVVPNLSKSRKAKKHIAFSLESFEQEKANGQRKVEIFTDSKERMPVVDDDIDNPFVEQKGKRKAVLDRSHDKKRTTAPPKHGMTKEVDDAVANGQGMVYTFRGKKIYRPFTDASQDPAALSITTTPPNADPEDEQDVLSHRIGASARRPFTRSSIKPRLLFPPQAEPDVTLLDEEADTDIEPSHSTSDAQPLLSEEGDSGNTDQATPRSAHFMPITPPTTMRKKKVSPFDSWSRVKPGTAAGGGGRSVSAKRAGPALEKESAAGSKRSRSEQSGPP